MKLRSQMLNRIIVPLDGSQLSHAALPVARSLAARTGAGVTLMSVIDPPRDFYIVPQGASTTRLRPKDVEHLAEEERRLTTYLEGVRTTFEGERVNVEIRLGDPAEEILDVAESMSNVVIVMASHGRSGIGRMFLGSVANRVVQATFVPVIITKATEDAKNEYGKKRMDNVAVALDGSKLAEQALERAYNIFKNGVGYTLIRIVEPVAPGQQYTSETIADYERKAREIADEYIQEQVDALTIRGATVSGDVRVTQPSSGITHSADELGADLIAMTTHGRSGMGRFLMGSVAERVLRNAERPVMIVRGVAENE
jgi:nucleotide-binding universal stress UspA family protein